MGLWMDGWMGWYMDKWDGINVIDNWVDEWMGGTVE
jgi:hypothetical protein